MEKSGKKQNGQDFASIVIPKNHAFSFRCSTRVKLYGKIKAIKSS